MAGECPLPHLALFLLIPLNLLPLYTDIPLQPRVDSSSNGYLRGANNIRLPLMLKRVKINKDLFYFRSSGKMRVLTKQGFWEQEIQD